ncbi:RnfABCDGE type electron transport complex subunit D [Velocimicrobium porci]|mgnify:CR=1 FL=1|uniref:Ion-translocating oxidoreductase complex subunit D n=1 Tax=Velocimicrobium porci TaxID=2606634 RepID=A0A6L5XVH2_9FIRM|nr:RnfABCDGE type electron transport complex subunit D [Velocimicrobium porci]
MSDLLHVSASPHVRSKTSTKTIMRDVAIALLPASAFGVYQFGIKALLLILTCVAASVLSEYIYEKAMKKPITTYDYSAVVTGLLLALNLPSTAPIWLAVIGSVFAIIVVKQVFGGLGQNFMNPALGARCFLLISFTSRMTDFSIDGVAGATPLAAVKAGEIVPIFDMFIGKTSGTIGETSVICILIGAVYLLIKKIITPRIPFIYIGTLLVFAGIFGGHGFEPSYLAAQLFGGGLMLGAFFMATDYVTSPITPMGQVIFAVCLGILTGIFRIFGGSAEGVSYAIIFCNLLVPLIEKVTIPVPFGFRKEDLKNEK